MILLCRVSGKTAFVSAVAIAVRKRGHADDLFEDLDHAFRAAESRLTRDGADLGVGLYLYEHPLRVLDPAATNLLDDRVMDFPGDTYPRVLADNTASAPARCGRRSIAPHGARPRHTRTLLKLIPYKRIGEPEDIGRAAVWLASDDSDYITGTTLFIDGGMTLYPGFEAGG